MTQSNIFILAIESSCDDTSAAVIKDGTVLSNCIANQDVHAQYGGVVPELASRMHDKNIVPVVNAALSKAGVKKEQLNAVAVTRGPGLLGSLIVGVNFAKSLSLGLQIPLVEVNHMEAHVMAHFAEQPYPEFPFLCLTVSGGHTQIVKVSDYNNMEVLGSTIDDAAGEAFDKTGKMLGLPYPAGPVIDKKAREGDALFSFPEPQVGELDFSFSGLKTSILYFVKKQLKADASFVESNLNNICASVQNTIVSILIKKIAIAAEKYNIQSIALAGGVSANSQLREAFTELGKTRRWKTYIPQFQYCTDNAGMIGISGYYHYLNEKYADQSIEPDPRLKI